MSKVLRIVFNDDVTQDQVDKLSEIVTDALELADITAVQFVEDVSDKDVENGSAPS